MDATYDSALYSRISKTMKRTIASAIAGPPDSMKHLFDDKVQGIVMAAYCAMADNIANDLHEKFPERSVDQICLDLGVPKELLEHHRERARLARL